MKKFIWLAILFIIPILLLGIAGESEFVVLKSDADTIKIGATDTIYVDTFETPLAHYKATYLYTYIKGLGTIEATDTFRIEKDSYIDSAGSLFKVSSTTKDYANTLAAGCKIDTLLYVGRTEYHIVRWIALDDDAAGTDDSLAVGPIGIGYIGRVDGR